MADTKQSKAIAAANTMVTLMQILGGANPPPAYGMSIREAFTEFVKEYNSETYNTVWAAMATAPQNADGSLGTADGSPNTAHPIDTRVYPTLNKAVSQTMLVAGVTLMSDFANFVGNVAVSTANRSQTIDDLAS